MNVIETSLEETKSKIDYYKLQKEIEAMHRNFISENVDEELDACESCC